MNEFYTNVSIRGNNILLRGYSNDTPIQEKIEFKPTLFVSSSQKTEYRTLDGKFIEPINPGSISDCREFIRKYNDVSGFNVYGNTDYGYQFIGNNYSSLIDYDLDKLKICTFDIETTCEEGFPDVNNPTEKVIAITVDLNGKKTVFGLGNYEINKDNVECFEFDTEEDLLTSFIECWEQNIPDIITGWNIRFFDVPYLINRICYVLNKSFAKK